MKVLFINGSPHQQGCTYTALREVADTLEANGVETDFIHLGTTAVSGCIACRQCKATGRCVFKDKVNEVLDKLSDIDGIVVGSPVYYGSASGQLTAFLDRLFFAGGTSFSGKLGAAVVSCRRGGASAAFDQLNKYFMMNCMTVVSSQYWNQVHGNTPEEVRKDEEGIQTMKILGTYMAWLLKCIELGKNYGIDKPKREPIVFTNFIKSN